MDPSNVIALCSVIGSVGSLIAVFYLATVKIAKMEVKVETLWAFLLRRGESESVTSGLATRNSPVVVTQAAKGLVDGLTVELQALYKSLPANATDGDLASKIEELYGVRIRDEVCIPNNISHGACLTICMAVAKDQPVEQGGKHEAA